MEVDREAGGALDSGAGAGRDGSEAGRELTVSAARDARCLRFRDFELDERTLELRRGGRPVPLQPQPARVLVRLASRPGELIRREELSRSIWGDLHVNAEQGLNNAIHQIRAALDDDADAPRFLETLPRAGYRFVAPVERRPGAGSTGIAPRRAWRRRWLTIPIGLAAAAALVLVARDGPAEREGPGSPERADAPRLAVLPFEILGDGALAPLRSVLSEELITSLATVDPDRLAVIARGSIRGYEREQPSLDRVARELAVDFAVEGSVREESGRTLVASRLVRVADGATLWSGKFELSAGDPGSATDWLSRQLRTALVTRVVSAGLPAPRQRPRPASSAAWEAYLEGRYRLTRADAGGPEAARAAFERSLAADSAYAPARLGLAEALWRGGEDDAERRRAALEAVEKALAQAPDLAMAHLLRGEIGFYHEWDAELAERHYARALALGPGLSEVHAVYAFHLAMRGDAARAIVEADLARELDPISAVTRSDVGVIYAGAGRPDLAIPECELALELEPGAVYAVACLIDAHVELGELGAAASLARAWREATAAGEPLRFPPAAGGEPSELESFFAWRLQRLSDPAAGVAPAWIGLAAARAGDVDRSIESLAEARRRRSPAFLLVAASPALRAVRSDPRFAELVAGTPVAGLAARG